MMKKTMVTRINTMGMVSSNRVMRKFRIEEDINKPPLTEVVGARARLAPTDSYDQRTACDYSYSLPTS